MESLLNLTTNARRFLRILVNFPLFSARNIQRAYTRTVCGKALVIAYLSHFPRL